MDLVRYPEYKDSDIVWLNKIPKEWNIEKVKHVLCNRNEKNNPIKSDNILSLTVTRGVIPYSEKGDVGNKSKDNLEEYKLAYPNDIVMNSMNVIIGSVDISKYFGCVSPVYYMFYSDNENYNIHYFNYIFQTTVFQKSLKGLGNGILDIRMRIPLDKFNQVLLPLPDAKTQNKIANYLDNKIAKIDKTIENNQKLIELLEEKRVALINQVVTKGLNPNVEMKDSGVEWIGEIPEHWEIEKLKNISQVKPSNVDKKSKDNEPSVLLCNYTDVYNNEFITMNLDFMKATASYDQIGKLSLDVGDIIITKDSESADDIAVPAFVSEKLNNVVCGYHLAVIRPNTNNIYPKFLFRSFESDKINKQFEYGANGVTRFGLGTYPINNAYICMPSLTEQKQIANYLDNETSIIIKVINKIKEHIELLEEYKESLIYHVVTGKVDVRGEDI